MKSILLKANEQWFNNIKNYHNNKIIAFANYWSIHDVVKNLDDGAKVYLYVDQPDKEYVKVLAQGVFRSSIYNPNGNKLFIKDTERKGEVQEIYQLYQLANGAGCYDDFKYLVQNHCYNKKHIIKVADDTIINSTIITDLSFNKVTYEMMDRGRVNQNGTRYIEKIQGKEMYFI